MRGIDPDRSPLASPSSVATPLAAIVAVALAIAFVVHAQAWAFLSDDAFISFRYARHLAEHGALQFNLGERVEGYTNFLWVIQLATLAGFGVEPHRAAPALTVLWAAAALVAATMLTHALRRRFGPSAPPELAVVDLVPGALLVASPELMAWTGSGLETAMAAALVLVSMVAFTRGRLVAAAGAAAAAVLTRPDASIPIAAFGLAWLLVVGGPLLARRRRSAVTDLPWKRIGVATLVFVLPVLAHLLWRRAYYGAWLPNTWTIKAHGQLLRPTYGSWYVQAWVEAMHLWALLPLLVLVRPRHLLLLAPIAAVVGYGWWVGGDFMAYSRFYLVATIALAILVGWLLSEAARLLARFVAYPALPRILTAGLGFALAAALAIDGRARLQADRAKEAGWLDGKWEGITAMDRFARVGLAVGTWMRANLPEDTLITVGAAGAVPYGSDLPVLDAYGLVDPYIASMPDAGPYTGRGARPGHQLQAPVHYIRERDPDLLCHVGYRGPRRPPPNRAHRAFRRGYTWACIEPDPIQDSTAEGGRLDVGFYCCRRPVDRVVGPFGAQEGR